MREKSKSFNIFIPLLPALFCVAPSDGTISVLCSVFNKTSMELYQSFLEYEQQFKGIDAIDYTRNHAEIPLFAIGCYLLFIFYFPKMQEWGMIPNTRLPLKRVFAMWNLSLSLFSIMGASRVVPYLFRELANPDNGTTFMDRFVFSVCGNSMAWKVPRGSPHMPPPLPAALRSEICPDRTG